MIPQKENRLLKVGVLGCGPIAQFAHLEACKKARNASLYAICDVAEDLVQRLGTYYQPHKTYTDYDAMLADPELEAVVIATADSFHVEATEKALLAGKHVLVEKPFGLDLGQCLVLKSLAEKTELFVQVAHMKRFDPGIAFAQQFVKEELGEMIALKAWYCDSSQRYEATDSLHPVHLISDQTKKPLKNPKADLEKYYMRAHGSHLVDTAFFQDLKIMHNHLLQKHQENLQLLGIHL